MARLVLPAGAKPEDNSWIERDGKPISWAQVAQENNVEIADDQWLADNGVVRDQSYGIREETPPPPVEQTTDDGRTLNDLAAQLDAVTAKLEAKAVFTKQDTSDIGSVKAADIEVAAAQAEVDG